MGINTIWLEEMVSRCRYCSMAFDYVIVIVRWASHENFLKVTRPNKEGRVRQIYVYSLIAANIEWEKGASLRVHTINFTRSRRMKATKEEKRNESVARKNFSSFLAFHENCALASTKRNIHFNRKLKTFSNPQSPQTSSFSQISIFIQHSPKHWPKKKSRSKYFHLKIKRALASQPSSRYCYRPNFFIHLLFLHTVIYDPCYSFCLLTCSLFSPGHQNSVRNNDCGFRLENYFYTNLI